MGAAVRARPISGAPLSAQPMRDHVGAGTWSPQPCSPMSGTKRTAASTSHSKSTSDLRMDPRERLRVLVAAQGDDQLASVDELRQKGERRLGGAGGDGDRVVGGVLGEAQRAVAAGDVHVREAEAREPLARGPGGAPGPARW